jgi:hypothetical protein
MANENSNHEIGSAKTVGDIVDVALKIAEKRHEIQLQIKEALLADDVERVRHLASQLVGLEP